MSQAKILQYVCSNESSTVDEHIAHFRNLEKQISIAIEREDEQLIPCLDNEIENCWQKLLTVLPEQRDDIIILLEFFLDQLCRNMELGELSSQAKERIIFLAKHIK